MGTNTIGLKLEGLKVQQSSASLSGINRKSVEHTKHKKKKTVILEVVKHAAFKACNLSERCKTLLTRFIMNGVLEKIKKKVSPIDQCFSCYNILITVKRAYIGNSMHWLIG